MENKKDIPETEEIQAFHESILDQLPVPVVVVSAPGGTLRYVNRAAAALLGMPDLSVYKNLTFMEVRQKRSWNYVHADGSALDPQKHPLAKALKGIATTSQELWILREDGTSRFVLLNAAPICDSERKILAGAVTYQDITEFKQAENAAREIQAQLDRLLQDTKLGNWELDTQTGGAQVDVRTAQMLGYDTEALNPNNLPWSQQVHPDDLPLLQELYNSHLKNGADNYESTHRLRHRSGDWIWVRSRGKILARDASGHPLRSAGTYLDITASRLATEQLRQIANEQQTILKTISMGITFLKNQTIQWANPSMAHTFGYPIDELQGLNTRSFYSREEDYIRIITQGCLQLSAGGIYRTQAPMRRKDGTPIWCSISGQAVNPQNLEEGSIWIWHDITEQRQFEESLRIGEERFKRLLQNSNDVITVADEKGVQISVSGPLENMLGYKPEELVGTNGFDGIHPDDVDHAYKIFLEALHQPGVVRRVEYRHRHKNGHWIPLEVVGSNLLHDPAVRGVVLNIRDTTERNKLQEQLHQAMKMEAVGRLAGGVAHDFNNLLTTIAGNAQLARMGLDDSNPISVHLDEINQACISAVGLTRQLLSFSRRQIIEPIAVDLNDLLKNLQKMLMRLLGEDIALHAKLAEDLNPVKIDPGQFEQVFINLAVNSRDAMPNGGRLTIATANVELDELYCKTHPQVQPGQYVLAAITDTGQGLSKEAKKHLFEPFFTTKPKGVGTGLGLATIFGTVQQAGGTIEVYSEEGLGATFKIYLPVAARPAEKLAHEKPVRDLAKGDETILIVEDEANVRGLAVAVLKRAGYNVLQASDGKEACGIAGKHAEPIHLLMTDVVMPGMNGRELAECLVKLHPETSVLYTSGYTEDVMIHHGVLDETLNFIGKPYNVKALARKVREVLDGKHDRS